MSLEAFDYIRAVMDLGMVAELIKGEGLNGFAPVEPFFTLQNKEGAEPFL